jgi:hypothetical protein
LEIGIVVILLILLFVSYAIVQETRAQLHWRGLVQDGDLDAIRTLLQNEIDTWHTARVPRGTPALLWHGIQTVELIDVSPTSAHLNCSAEGEYSLAAGKRVETSSALSEGMKITMKLAEMALYDVPNVKLDSVQIDVYTSFRDARGHAEPLCILSTLVRRTVVEHLDWEETSATDFIELSQGRFDTEGSGTIQAIEPLAWAEDATRRP